MLGPDAVEKAQYLPTGPVKPTQQSDRDKRQKFKDALKEELEDEQGRKRRRTPEDKLDLEVVPEDEFTGQRESEREEQAEQEAASDDKDEESTGETDQENGGSTGQAGPGHIDVKA